MSTIHKNIIIDAPAIKVWDVLGEAAQWRNLNPNVSNYSYVLCEDGGYKGEWVYMLGKLRLLAKIRTNFYGPQRRLVVETCGQMKSKWIWWLESDGNWTHLALTLEYTVNWSGVGAVFHKEIIEHLHSKSLNTYLSNIRREVGKMHK